MLRQSTCLLTCWLIYLLHEKELRVMSLLIWVTVNGTKPLSHLHGFLTVQKNSLTFIPGLHAGDK